VGTQFKHAAGCWQCGTPAEHDLFCRYCNSLQKPRLDYYRFFGLERKLDLDEADLKRRFYDLSRLLHPDRYTRKPATERQFSLEATAILNDAYRVLRDPVARAEYVLKQSGFEAPGPRSKSVAPELLEEVFELNVALEELRDGDESARPQLVAARDRFASLREGIDRELAALFARYDASPDESVLGEIRGQLDRRRYIQNLMAEVEKELAL
jgi:molecular chaperone HscB